MGLDRARLDPELPGHLGIGQALGHEREHLTFAIGEPGQGCGGLVGHLRCRTQRRDEVASDGRVQPGLACSHAAHGIDEVRGPTPVMSVWLGLLGLGAVVFVATSPRVRMR